MTETYLGPERRSVERQPFDLQVVLAKLIAKVESTEQNITLKIESLEVIRAAANETLENRVETIISRLEDKVMAAVCAAEAASVDAKTALENQHTDGHRFTQIETTGRGMIDTIDSHEQSIKKLNSRVTTLEQAPGVVSWAILKRILTIAGTAAVMGLLGLIWYAMRHPEAFK